MEHGRRSEMRRNLFDHLKPEEALAARILSKLEERCGFNGRITKRELEREMNANTRPLWAEAWQLLIRDNCIRLSAGPNRQQFIDQPKIPDYLRPRETIKKPLRPRRRRKRTEWFKERLPEFLRRDGYHELADAIEAMAWQSEDDVPLQYVPGEPAGTLRLSWFAWLRVHAAGVS
jgi:hypothetical protein